MAIKVISPKKSLKGFDVKTFLLGFKKPAIILITAGLTYLSTSATGADLIALMGGSSIVIERLWALAEFYIKKISNVKK